MKKKYYTHIFGNNNQKSQFSKFPKCESDTIAFIACWPSTVVATWNKKIKIFTKFDINLHQFLKFLIKTKIKSFNENLSQWNYRKIIFRTLISGTTSPLNEIKSGIRVKQITSILRMFGMKQNRRIRAQINVLHLEG